MRADRIKAGYSLAGHPNRKVTAVERFTREKSPTGSPDGRSWVRITTESGKSQDYPPDWPLEVWTNTDADLDDDDL